MNNWKTIKLGELTEFQGGSQPPKNQFIYEPREGYVRFLQIRDFTSDKNKTYIPVSSQNRLCNEDDVLIGRYGASVGKILTGKSGAYNVAIIKTIPNENLVEKKFLLYFLQSKFFQENLQQVASRAAQAGFSKSDIHDFPVPLPFSNEPELSLAEQRRIVARIEALLAEVREMRVLQKGIADDASELLKATRREIFGTQLQSDWIPLSTYVRFIENGRSPQAQNRPAQGQEWGVLKVGAVTYGYFKHDENKALLPGTEPNIEFEVKQGDFLMSRANTLTLVGACALVKQPPPPRLLLSDKTFRFHFFDEAAISPVFLDHVLKSPALRAQIETVASGTSPTMKNISKAKVMALLVPPYSIREQESLAFHLEKISSEIKEMQELSQVDEKLLRSVEQAILNQAFRGEL